MHFGWQGHRSSLSSPAVPLCAAPERHPQEEEHLFCLADVALSNHSGTLRLSSCRRWRCSDASGSSRCGRRGLTSSFRRGNDVTELRLCHRRLLASWRRLSSASTRTASASLSPSCAAVEGWSVAVLDAAAVMCWPPQPAFVRVSLEWTSWRDYPLQGGAFSLIGLSKVDKGVITMHTLILIRSKMWIME